MSVHGDLTSVFEVTVGRSVKPENNQHHELGGLSLDERESCNQDRRSVSLHANIVLTFRVDVLVLCRIARENADSIPVKLSRLMSIINGQFVGLHPSAAIEDVSESFQVFHVSDLGNLYNVY